MTESANSAVANDMARVFAALPASTRRTALDRPPETAPLPRHRLGIVLAGWIFILLACLAVWFAVSQLTRTAAPVSDRPVEVRSERAPIVPPSALPQADTASVVPTPPVVAGDSPTIGEGERETVADRSTPLESAATRPPTVRESGDARPRSQVSDVRIDRQVCRRADDREQCLAREVDDADARLRTAYDRALDTPRVSTSELADVRWEWDAAVSRAARDPEVAIRTLDSLGTRLYNQIEEASLARSRDR